MKQALIIFVRNPILGKVKTRIAKDLGDEAALEVYKKLLSHTHNISSQSECDRFVFYADYINKVDLWENENYKKRLQSGNDLGERMHNAFEQLFNEGYKQIAIIGSDCHDLTSTIIEEAFDALQNKDSVVGGTFDGGYYLLGMNTMIPEVFTNKQWSTDTVFADTILSITTAGYHYHLLPKLSDVDNAEDCSRYTSLLSPTHS